MTWFEHFFEGMAADVWSAAASSEQTAAEVAFLIEHLRLDKGQHVLDVPCADGRLAIPLAQRGIRVTGVDLSARVQSLAADANLPFTIDQADMRLLAYNGAFDAAFCMGNSFGYFDRADTCRFLAGVRRALVPGGGFIIHTVLAAETFFTLGGTREWTQQDGTVMLMENSYDCRHNRLDSKFVFLRGDNREEHATQHYVFTSGEICRMCEESGLHIEALFGSAEGEDFSVGSDNLFIYATKQA